ncbi:MAG: hypothetical protein P9L96_05920 [Candidatus Gygaella obscura]|nr:hypothetical protein [Candidatus Gygaella obscura]
MTTGIGSVSFNNPKPALEYIFDYVDIPFWPQLTNLSKFESMGLQFSENIPCLKQENKDLVYEASSCEKNLERCYEHIIAEDTGFFKISTEYAQGLYAFLDFLKKKNTSRGYIKGHTTGPFSFAAAVKKEKGLLLADSVMMEVITKALAMKALWQVRELKKFSEQVMFFIDEPYLSCFGSGFTSINKEIVQLYLSQFIDLLRKEQVLIGIHCCGNTDWGLLMGLDIDIINFDAFNFADKFLLYSQDIKEFLQKGGILAWGIVPTNGYKDDITSNELKNSINSYMETLEKKGIDHSLVASNSLITPSCGLGSIEKDINQSIFKLLKSTADLLKKELS